MAVVFLGGAVIAGAAGAGVVISKREGMKKGDVGIEEERVRERKMEKQFGQNEAFQADFHHHTHDHLLNEVEGSQWFTCGSCNQAGTGRRYHCATCNFNLHKVCSSSPAQLGQSVELEAAPIQSFVHDCQLKEVYKYDDTFDCDHCRNAGDGVRFSCDNCKFKCHPVCAKNPTRLSSYIHPTHELELKTRKLFHDCVLCGHGGTINNRVYRCKTCKVYLHPTCSQWPQYLFHELHPVKHVLQLKILDSKVKCNACNIKCRHSAYSCGYCDQSFHPKCLLKHTLRSNVEEVTSAGIAAINLAAALLQ